MNTSKCQRQSKSCEEEKVISTSMSVFLETPSTSVSQTTENHRQIDCQEQFNGFHRKRLRCVREHFDSSTRMKKKQTKVKRTKTMLNQTSNDRNEDDWVCPVAVALRRAGYDVPLRPSKSWLERDRQQQALLRQRRTSSKEI